MNEVKDVMSRPVRTIEPTATLERTAMLMNELGVGALPVQEQDRLVGMITDRDISLRATARDLDPAHALVRDVMTEGVITCFQDHTVEEAAEIMEKFHVRRLPVLSRDRHLVGIVTLDDIAADGSYVKLAGQILQSIAHKPQPRVPTFHRILVALDGSSLAEQVLTYVEPLAEHLGSRITLLRSVSPIGAIEAAVTEREPKAAADSRAIATIVPISGETRANAGEYLAAVQTRLESVGLTVDCEFPENLPGPAIVQRSQHLNADLIAMTTHGRGGLSRAVHGSVADYVLHHAPCPVLLVRAHEN